MKPSGRYAIVIPACNEEACIREMLAELTGVLDLKQFLIAVGVNGSTDGTARLVREFTAQHGEELIVAEIEKRGYGHGCQAAIDLVELATEENPVDGYIFVAADGANDPKDIAILVERHRSGFDMVLGCRTTLPDNRVVMGWRHTLSNRILGAWCGILTGRYFVDLGPLRLIDRTLFQQLQLREWTYGWTIEAQIRAVQSGARICEIAVRERLRIAGNQKVSGVSWRHTITVGAQIVAAGWRSFRAYRTDRTLRS